MSLAAAITDLGDPAFLLPASAVMLWCLWASDAERTAADWAVALTACLGTIVLLKILFEACTIDSSGLSLRSPSGHAAFSTVVYGSGALLVGRGRGAVWKAYVWTGAAILVGAIAASRVMLGAHSKAETVVGLLVGVCCLAWFAPRIPSWRWTAQSWSRALAVLLALAVLTHGIHLTLERPIARLAHLLQAETELCRTL